MHSHCIATRTLSNYYYRDRRRTSDGARARRARRPRWHQRRGRRPCARLPRRTRPSRRDSMSLAAPLVRACRLQHPPRALEAYPLAWRSSQRPITSGLSVSSWPERRALARLRYANTRLQSRGRSKSLAPLPRCRRAAPFGHPGTVRRTRSRAVRRSWAGK